MTRFFLFSVGVSLMASCGPTATVCGPSNCQGCCDGQGVCQTGDLNKECGRLGFECSSCAGPLVCSLGLCTAGSVGATGGSSGGTGGAAGGGIGVTGGGGGSAGGGGGSGAGGTGGGSGSTGGSGGSSGGGAGGGQGQLESLVDRSSCLGTGQVSGTVAGQALSGTTSSANVTSYGALGVTIFTPPIVTGTRIFIVEFTPQLGQFNYSSANARCGVGRRTSTDWVGVEPAAACEVQLAALEFASTQDMCTGIAAGQVQALFSGNTVVTSAFVVPIQDLFPSATGCRRSNDNCSRNSDCCSQSCSPVLGLCY